MEKPIKAAYSFLLILDEMLPKYLLLFRCLVYMPFSAIELVLSVL